MHDGVAHLIATRYPYTLELTLAALLVGLLVAIPAGVVAAVRRGRWLDQVIGVGSLLGLSVPSFALGPLLILVFSIALGWLPVSGAGTGGFFTAEGWPYLVLPAGVMGLSLAAVMPHFGFGTRTLDGKRELPSRYFHDLATWQFINRLYSNKVMSELKHIRYEAERRDLLDRFVVLVEERRGHSLALAVERAKIDLTHKPEAWLDMRPFHQPTKIAIERHVFDGAIDLGVQRVVGAVKDVLTQAGLQPSAIGHVFVTGGSSSVPLLRGFLASDERFGAGAGTGGSSGCRMPLASRRSAGPGFDIASSKSAK